MQIWGLRRASLGDLAGKGVALGFFLAALGPRELAGAPGRRLSDDGDLGRSHPTDPAERRRDATEVLPAHPAGRTRLARGRRAGGSSWRVAGRGRRPVGVPRGLLCTLLASLAVFGALFATGYWLYGEMGAAAMAAAVAGVSSVLLVRIWASN